MQFSKAKSVARINPKESSYDTLNPVRFKTQFYGFIARNDIEKKQTELRRQMETLSQELRELENHAKMVEDGVVELDDDDDLEDDMEPNVMSDNDFESCFEPEEMRCLALVAHNHMKPAMRLFVEGNKNILKKFRLTGTNTTMSMLHEVFGDDPAVRYGPTCQSGPLGGDAELCALMVMEELGGMIFLQDPMDAHPHTVDIESLNRQANVHDVLVAGNCSSAYAMTAVLRTALRFGKKGMIGSFFKTEYTPAVTEYFKRNSVVPTPIVDEETQFIDDQAAKKQAMQAMRSGRSLTKGLSVAILNVNAENKAHRRKSTVTFNANNAAEAVQQMDLEEIDVELDDYDMDDHFEDGEIFTEVNDNDFFSQFMAEEMRCLALLAHKHLKAELKLFVEKNKNVLRKFRLTGNLSTMKMLKEVYGDDPMVRYGPTCQSGTLGGDSQICALMCLGQLGGMVFLQDPMYAHPHQVDIDCLNRQANVHDVYVANNPNSAYAMMTVLRKSLKKGNRARISSFFETKKSPSVAEYKKRQKAVLDANIAAAKMKEEADAFSELQKNRSRGLQKKKNSMSKSFSLFSSKKI